MSYLELVDKFVNETGIGKETEKKELVKTIHSKIDFNDIPLLTLSEFKDCDFVLKVFSSVLNCHVWFCSNEGMVKQILEDDRTATAYTMDELIKLIELNPSKKFLKKIHDTKTVFDDSTIVKTINKKKTDHD